MNTETMEAPVKQWNLIDLRESPTNPRKAFDKHYISGLAASIKERGVLNPLIVRPVGSTDALYEIVAGACRFRAAKEAKLSTIPVRVLELDDEAVLEVQLIENLQRADVHPLDEAEGYVALLKAIKGLPSTDNPNVQAELLARKVGKSTGYIRQRMQLAMLIEPLKKLFRSEELNVSQAIMLARLNAEQQKETVVWFKHNTHTTGELAQQIRRQFFLTLSKAPFDTADSQLYEAAGACVSCPKRTGANALLFADVKEQDTCTDPRCFDQKCNNLVKIAVGTHPEATMLTVGRYYGGEPKGRIDWVRAGAKKCEHTTEGIVVELRGETFAEKEKAKLAEVFKVCLNEKCKIHHPELVRRDNDYDSQTGTTRGAVKKKRIEQKRRILLFRELAAKPLKITESDRREVLKWAVSCLKNDDARYVCQALEIEPAKHQYGGNDFSGSVAKKLADVKPTEIEHWLYLIMLGSAEMWANYKPTCKLMDAKAKSSGIQLAKIALAAKTKAPKKAAAKA